MIRRYVVRRVEKLLEGSEHPRSVAWAVVLGLAAGFVCGWNLTLAAILLVVTLLNLHTRCFLVCWAGGVLLASWLDPVASRLGYVLLDGTPLGHAVGGLGDHPLIVLLGWDRYEWVGGLALALLLAWPLSNSAARWIVRRQTLLAANRHRGCLDDHDKNRGDKSEEKKATSIDDSLERLDTPWIPRLGLLERVAGRLLFGPMPDNGSERSVARPIEPAAARSRAEAHGKDDETSRRAPVADVATDALPSSRYLAGRAPGDSFFRPLGWAVAPLLVGAVGLLVYAVGPILVRKAVLDNLAAFNTATVEAARLDVSLWDGRFEIEGLRLADPAALDRDRLVVARATGKLDAGQLLRGRLDIETLDVDGVCFHVARNTPAEPVLEPIGMGRAVDGLGLPSLNLASDEPHLEAIAVEHHLAIWPRLQTHLATVKGTLEQLRRLQQWDANFAPARVHFALLAYPWKKRSSLGHDGPLVSVRRMRVEHVSEPASLGPRGVLELADFSSRSGGPSGKATRLNVVVPHVALEIEATLRLAEPKPMHTVRLRAYDVDLASLIATADGPNCLQITGGLVDLAGQGTFDPHGIDLPLKVDARKLVARVTQADRLAGLRRETWNAGLSRVRQLSGDIHLEGPWNAPRLLLDPQAIVLQLKHQLRAAGEHRLVAAIEADLAEPNATMPVVAKRGSGINKEPAATSLPSRRVASGERPSGPAAAPTHQNGATDSDSRQQNNRPQAAEAVAGSNGTTDSPGEPRERMARPSPETTAREIAGSDPPIDESGRPAKTTWNIASSVKSSGGSDDRRASNAVAARDEGIVVGLAESELPRPIDWQIGYDEKESADVEDPHVLSRTGSRWAESSPPVKPDVPNTSAHRVDHVVEQTPRSGSEPTSGESGEREHENGWELAIGYEDRFAPRPASPPRRNRDNSRATAALRVPIDRSAGASQATSPPLPERRSTLGAAGGPSASANAGAVLSSNHHGNHATGRAPWAGGRSQRSMTTRDPWMWPKQAWRRVASVFSRRRSEPATIAPPEPIGPPLPATSTPWATSPTGSGVSTAPPPLIAERIVPRAAASRLSASASNPTPDKRSPAAAPQPSQQRSASPSSGGAGTWYERLWR